MKGFVFLFGSVLISTISIGSTEKCPDGSDCGDGQCCQRLVFVRSYWCCRGVFQCRRTLGVGYCFLFSEPKPQQSEPRPHLSEENLSEENNSSEENDYDDIPESPENKIAFADALMEVLRMRNISGHYTRGKHSNDLQN